MAERTIVGVDFSGRANRNTTEVTTAMLRGDVLEVQPYRPLPRTLPATHNTLIAVLTQLQPDAVVALDFPFSVPWAFARELASNQLTSIPTKMLELWAIANDIHYRDFEHLLISFVERRGELHRQGDLYVDGPLSPLNLRMRLMTFRGMELLYQLWNCENPRFRVPPLSDDGRDGPILLETMPGVLLRSFGLPSANYKGKNKINGGVPENVRYEILDGLEKTSPLVLRIPDDIREQCISNDDCLDSLVAAIVAALWAMDMDGTNFRHPNDNKISALKRTSNARRQASPQIIEEGLTERQAARREGCIYAPKPTKQ
jgi:hypothetical protein